MDMSHGMGMSMGSMSMGGGGPSMFDLQKMFWAVVGAAIASATLVNVYNKLLYRQRYVNGQCPRALADGYLGYRLRAVSI